MVSFSIDVNPTILVLTATLVRVLCKVFNVIVDNYREVEHRICLLSRSDRIAIVCCSPVVTIQLLHSPRGFICDEVKIGSAVVRSIVALAEIIDRVVGCCECVELKTTCNSERVPPFPRRTSVLTLCRNRGLSRAGVNHVSSGEKPPHYCWS